MTHGPVPHVRVPALSECIDNCQECHLTCLDTIGYCLAEGGSYAEGALIDLLSACADICASHTDSLTRGAPPQVVSSSACAALCLRCAVACEALAGEDTQMLRCARACRRCAKSCDAIAGH